jgi:hypothetical protein
MTLKRLFIDEEYGSRECELGGFLLIFNPLILVRNASGCFDSWKSSDHAGFRWQFLKPVWFGCFNSFQNGLGTTKIKLSCWIM